MNTIISENRPRYATYIVTIRDVIKAINTYEVSDLDEVIQAVSESFNTSYDDAEYAVQAAYELGYITDQGGFTQKGKEYDVMIRDCISRREQEKGKENDEKFWPSNILYLIRGLPGSGKTVLGANLVKGLGQNAVQIEIDSFISDKVAIDIRTMRKAALECHAEVEKALIEGKDVVVTNIFARYKDIIPYFELATYHSIRTQLIDTQSQWNSESRSTKVRTTLAQKWSTITLPFRWKGWSADRRRKLEIAKRERQRYEEPNPNEDEIAILEEDLQS